MRVKQLVESRGVAAALVLRAGLGAGLCGVLFAGLVGNAHADPFDTIERLNQQQFLEFSENVSAATRYNGVTPPEFLGLLGFDVGIEVSSTDIDSSLFDLASDGDFDGSELIVTRAHAHKGFPFGLDLGASYALIPGTDASIVGGEVRYALLKGSVLSPAIGIRANYSQLTGVEDYGLRSAGVELGISKGFLLLTPYAGIGIVRTNADAGDLDGLSDETYNQNKYLVGLTISLGFALTLEMDYTGDHRTYSAKAGIRF